MDTRDNSVSWEKPKWNAGGWVGIVISSLFLLLPAVLLVIVAGLCVIWFCLCWVDSCERAAGCSPEQL